MQTTTPEPSAKSRGARLEARVSVDQKGALQQAAAPSGPAEPLADFSSRSRRTVASRVPETFVRDERGRR